MKQSMVRILRPNFIAIGSKGRITPTLADYIEVPRLSTWGTFTMEQSVRFTRRGLQTATRKK